jgi:hypothetical protein
MLGSVNGNGRSIHPRPHARDSHSVWLQHFLQQRCIKYHITLEQQTWLIDRQPSQPERIEIICGRVAWIDYELDIQFVGSFLQGFSNAVIQVSNDNHESRKTMLAQRLNQTLQNRNATYFRQAFGGVISQRLEPTSGAGSEQNCRAY